MSSTKDRLELGARLLALIEERRAQTGDSGLGSSMESFILERELRELIAKEAEPVPVLLRRAAQRRRR